MNPLKLITIGTSTGLVLPKEMLWRLRVERGDQLYVVESQLGYLLTPYDPVVAEEVEKGRRLMREYRETFKGLASTSEGPADDGE